MKDGEHEAKLFNDMKHIVTYKDGKKNGHGTWETAQCVCHLVLDMTGEKPISPLLMYELLVVL